MRDISKMQSASQMMREISVWPQCDGQMGITAAMMRLRLMQSLCCYDRGMPIGSIGERMHRALARRHHAREIAYFLITNTRHRQRFARCSLS